MQTANKVQQNTNSDTTNKTANKEPAAIKPAVQRRINIQRVPVTTPAAQSSAKQQMHAKNRALQFEARAMSGKPSSIQEIAAAGIQGSSQSLPHLNTIQKSFGRFKVGHVQAYTGSSARAASRAMGAEAYATGSKIAFNTTQPSLRTAAHEAAHTIQQQAGVHLSQGVGKVGDKYEQHADAVAELVVQGKSAENLLSESAQPHAVSTSSGAHFPVQRLACGIIPQGFPFNGNARNYKPLFPVGGIVYGAGWNFTAAQRAGILARNNAKYFAGGIPNPPNMTQVSDESNLKLLAPGGAIGGAYDLSPEIDHIVPKVDGGSNDERNARVLSGTENNPAAPTSRAANIRMVIYENNLSVKNYNTGAAKWTVNFGDVLTKAQIEDLEEYVHGPGNWAWPGFNLLDMTEVGHLNGIARGTKNNGIKIYP